jgi:hypothetical protein
VTSTSALQVSAPDDLFLVAIRPADPALAALLESKPTAEDVSLEVWWHVVQSLQHSLAVRRAREGVAVLTAEHLEQELHEAEAWAEAALAELGPGPSWRRTVGRHVEPGVRTTMSELARLIVSARCTEPQALRGALLDHLRALDAPRRAAR